MPLKTGKTEEETADVKTEEEPQGGGTLKEELAQPEGSFSGPQDMQTPEAGEEELTVGDLLPRRIITVQDVGKTAGDIFEEVKTDGVKDHTALTKQEEAILHDMLFGKYAAMEFNLSKLKFALRTISSEMSIISERFLSALVGDRAKSRDITQQELTVINSRLTLARYLLVFGPESFDSDTYETEEEFKRRYEFVSGLSVAVLDHCNLMVQRFVSIQNRVLVAETLINF